MSEAKTTSLHVLLAVDQRLKGQSQKKRTDLQKTNETRRHLFQKTLKTYTSDTPGSNPETREASEIETTVKKESQWLFETMAQAIDCSYAIDFANTQAKSNIVLDDGTVLAENVPATALLQLEHRMKEVHEYVKTIPTLDPAKGFVMDKDSGYYKARDVSKPSTQKMEDFITVAQATKEHPAQVQKVVKDVRIGTVLEQEWSSMITPSDKATMLGKVEELSRAVAQARARANGQSTEQNVHKIGKKLLDHVLSVLA